MGYKIMLPKEKSCIGIEIPDAYHSIDSVSLSGGYVTITVAVYPSREAKYNTGKIRSGMIGPKYLDVEDDGFSEIEPDVASATSIDYSPIRNVIIPKMGTYTLKISASALFPDAMPYDIESQKESLYPTVKRLLGHGNAEDVFEKTDEEAFVEWQEWNYLPYGNGGIGIYMEGDRVLRGGQLYESMKNDNTYDPLTADGNTWKKVTV